MSCLACCGEPPNSTGYIDPKTFLANERTFISWLHMSTTLGTVATALVALGTASSATLAATQILASALLLTAIIFCFHSMRTFDHRNRVIRRRADMTEFDDFWGPATVATCLLASWASVFALTLVKLGANDSVHASLKVWLNPSLAGNDV
uniref:DUF202 domain-containing protein n=1 Tax=Hemiselmis andersenii TaxID=464988 RepID=A0A6T8NI82_HEMAN|mmetsp:Transcript_3009/g.6876  ORF Transcript_3009/g.6876 Transcript_3009/m.6876 type:complete len:150 (+) Transcript_3009:48-497(+)